MVVLRSRSLPPSLTPIPAARALTAPAGHRNPPPLGAACARGAGATPWSPPRCPPLSPGDPPSARGSAGHSQRGSEKHDPPPQPQQGAPAPSILVPPQPCPPPCSLAQLTSGCGERVAGGGEGVGGQRGWAGGCGGSCPPAPSSNRSFSSSRRSPRWKISPSTALQDSDRQCRGDTEPHSTAGFRGWSGGGGGQTLTGRGQSPLRPPGAGAGLAGTPAPAHPEHPSAS